jgi:hypothetical protein
LEIGSISAVFALSEALGVPLLLKTKIMVKANAFVEILKNLVAFWHLNSSLDSVVVEALDVCSFVGKTR